MAGRRGAAMRPRKRRTEVARAEIDVRTAAGGAQAKEAVGTLGEQGTEFLCTSGENVPWA